jgi:hypothetical protein
MEQVSAGRWIWGAMPGSGWGSSASLHTSAPKLADKPGSVSPVSGAAVIYLGRRLPAVSCGLPEAQTGRAAPCPPKRVLPLLGLAPGGGCLAARVTTRAGGLLHHLFTITGTD